MIVWVIEIGKVEREKVDLYGRQPEVRALQEEAHAFRHQNGFPDKCLKAWFYGFGSVCLFKNSHANPTGTILRPVPHDTAA
jgi:hypothetical protein